MQRFYIKNLEIWKDIFALRDVNIVYQLVKVLRTRIGQEIILFDWINTVDYLCEIIDFSKKEIELKLLKKIGKKSELSLELNLVQAFPNKLDKVEYIIQKWVEVGISSFTFYRSDRSQKISITEKKEERLNKILVEAVEQSWRNIIPTLTLSSSTYKKGIIWEFVASVGKSIFLHTENKKSQTLKKYIKKYKKSEKRENKINIYIWPEWWLSEEEVENFEEKKFTRIHLWDRILRTETAWIVVAFTLGQML